MLPGYAIAYLQRCEVDDAVDIWALLKDCIERLLLSDVKVDEVWSLSTDELNAIQDFFRRVLQVVCDHHVVVIFQKGEGSEGSNVAAAPFALVSIE